MSFIRSIINYGINENTDISLLQSLRNRNIINIIIALVMISTGLAGSIFGILNIALINLISLIVFFIIVFLLPNIKPTLGGTLTISLAIINGLFIFALIPEFTLAILIFMMLIPLATYSLLRKKGLWISILLPLLLILINYFPISKAFVPIDTYTMILFTISYMIMNIGGTTITGVLRSHTEEQIAKVQYFESELAQRDEFIGNLSHKLRTSLSNITLINNLVHDSRMSSAQIDLLDTLRSSTYDLINDVNELVEIATPSIINFRQSIISFNLSTTLRGISSILDSDPDFKHKLNIQEDDGLKYQIIGDPNLLRTVLINLIKNICEYESHNNEIFLNISRDYDKQNMVGLRFNLNFSIKNADNLETSIIDLQQSDEPNISGIGNAFRLLKLTGSTPELRFGTESQDIYFIQDFSKDLTKKITIEEHKAEHKGRKRSLAESTMLLVEDNAINQKIVLLSLNKLVKHIDVANNGKEALDMFGLKRYDAILMDIQMPVMDGITATKKIREIESTSDQRIPIVAITANALAGDRDNCFAAGVDEYVSKPFQVDDLVQKISQLLEK